MDINMNNEADAVRRLELLKMARELLNEEYINRRAEDHNKWVAECDVAHANKQQRLPYPPFAQYPTEVEIVAKAVTLYNFVKPIPEAIILEENVSISDNIETEVVPVTEDIISEELIIEPAIVDVPVIDEIIVDTVVAEVVDSAEVAQIKAIFSSTIEAPWKTYAAVSDSTVTTTFAMPASINKIDEIPAEASPVLNSIKKQYAIPQVSSSIKQPFQLWGHPTTKGG